MDLPPLSNWTFETVSEVVRKHDFEPGSFDFKAALHGTGSKDAKSKLDTSIRKTACSMANSSGGHIIFGVGDAKKGGTALQRLEGMPQTSDLRKEFGEKLKGIDPNVYFDATPKAITHPDKPDRCFFVVYIPQSPRRPHMYEHVFWRRGSGGAAEQMTQQEVRDQVFLTEGVLSRLKLLRLELVSFRSRAFDLMSCSFALQDVATRFDTIGFRLLSADVSVLMPKDNSIYAHGLLLVAHQANCLNELLSFYLHHALESRGEAWKREAADAIKLAARKLIDLCESQSRTFDEHFGPLW